MNKEKNLVPKIRFPEFVNEGEWDIEPFSEIYSFYGTNSFTRDNLNYSNGDLKNIHYGDIHTKFRTHFDIQKETVPFVNSDISIEKIKEDSFCKEGDMIYADASEDLNDIGKSIEIINTNNEKILSGLHTLLARQKSNKLSIGFGGHLFKSPSIRTQIQKEAQGAKVLGISATRLSNTNVYYPENKEEQQKIASCLSSLDELIATHTDKLDALKDHKKGLMQQLFPAEGETVPKLRFKEFEKDGEWMETTLGKTFSIFQGFAFSSNDTSSEGTRWLKIADVSIQQMNPNTTSYLPFDFKERFAKFLVRKGDYVIALTRPILGRELKLAPIDDIYHESLLNQRVGKLESNNNLTFIYYLLQTTRIISFIEKNIAGSEPPNLSTQHVESIVTYLPPKPSEQHKIANFLSSIDDEIAAQTHKIEGLKEHKRGLMQGLFPVINE